MNFSAGAQPPFYPSAPTYGMTSGHRPLRAPNHRPRLRPDLSTAPQPPAPPKVVEPPTLAFNISMHPPTTTTETDITTSRNRTCGQGFTWPHTPASRYGAIAPGLTPTGSTSDQRQERKPIPAEPPKRRRADGHITGTSVNMWARNRICAQVPEWEQSVKRTGRERATGPGNRKRTVMKTALHLRRSIRSNCRDDRI